MADTDDMYKEHKHLDLDSFNIIFKYLKKYFGRVRSVNGVLPNPKDGNVLLPIETLTIDDIYPVGSIYSTVKDTDPNVIFPGTKWEPFGQGKFLLGSSAQYAANASGGSTTYTLTKEQLPSHTHTISNAGGHTHSGTAATAGGHCHGAMGITGGNSLYGIYDNTRNHVGVGDSVDYDNTIWKTSTNGDHTHTVTTESAGGHTHTAGNTGGNASINIIPPYIVVNRWVRTN